MSNVNLNNMISDKDFYVSKMIESSLKSRMNEPQDSESLNTMEYYNEDTINKKPSTEENMFISNKLYNIKKKISSSINEDSSNKSMLNKTYNGISFLSNKTGNCERTNSFFVKKNEKNVQKRIKEKETTNDYCIRCKEEIEFSSKACPHCLKPFCRKCLKIIFNRNLDNNDDIDNFDQDTINEKMCPNCRSLVAIKDYVIIDKNKKNFQTFEPKLTETLDNYSFTDDKNDNNQASLLSRELEEQYNEYDLFLNKIEQKKKELENKKNLNINILQMIQKVIEYEFNQNINKLNEMIDKLKKIQKTINQKRNNFSQQQNTIDNNLEMQKNYDTYQNTIKIFSKNYEKFNQKIISKSKQKAYNFHESKSLLINISDTYYMKYTEILSNSHIGNAFIKIERYINGYANCLNFSVLIKQNDKDSKNNKKSKFVVNMIINDKLIKLNKTNKDDNKLCLNYECSMEENILLFSKNNNLGNKIIKKDELNIKVIITELFI